jgi:hypothetical protein
VAKTKTSKASEKKAPFADANNAVRRELSLLWQVLGWRSPSSGNQYGYGDEVESPSKKRLKRAA